MLLVYQLVRSIGMKLIVMWSRQLDISPHKDTHLYCDDHSDMWQSGCPHCEENSQYHYETSVAEFLKSPASKMIVVSLDPT